MELKLLSFEQLWAIIQETSLGLKENRELIKELRDLQKETDKKLGSIGINTGITTEEYFYNSFEKSLCFARDKFDSIERNIKGSIKSVRDEYDIVLYNAKSIAIIEVKYKAHENDIEKTLKKAQTFKILFPMYKNFDIYLGLASFSFYAELEQKILDAGIAVVKQVGDTVVVEDERVKRF